MQTLEEITSAYRNDSETNLRFYKQFTDQVEQIEFLKTHRDYIEENKLGYGDRAFHYMWLVILQHLKREIPDRPLQLAEIGVFKGQVISLWSLILQKENIPAEVNAISPFKGNDPAGNRLISGLLKRLSGIYSKNRSEGNLYKNENYLKINEDLFRNFDLDFSKVRKHRGFSTDPAVLESTAGLAPDLLYIDGDHSYEGVLKDLENFGRKVKPGGIMVMDDASCNIPGGENGEYWKGHQRVSDACDNIDPAEWENILNIGHNRVYRKAI